MTEIPTIVTFDFDYGTKDIKDCNRDELLIVIKWASAEIQRLREEWKHDREMQKMLNEAYKRYD